MPLTKQKNRDNQINGPSLKKYPFIAVVIILAVLILHSSLLLININKGFTGLNEDDNALYGLAAQNLAKFGIWNMKFGMAPTYYSSFSEIGARYYTHHPQFFILPAALSYKLLGVSEASTRLPSIIFALFSLAAFYFIVYLNYDDRKIAIISTLSYALLPGLIFYSRSLSEKVFIIVFANFAVLAFFLLQRYKSSLSKVIFIFFIFYGGLQGWHFFFIPFSLWLYTVLNKKVTAKKFLLISLPITAGASLAFNLAHFYWLRGFDFIPDLIGSYIFWGSGMNISRFFQRYLHFISLNFTWLAVMVAFGYFLYLLRRIYKRQIDLPFIFFIQPFLVVLFFREWAGAHAFGSLYWAQFIALAIGLVIVKLLNYRPLRFYRYTAGAIIMLLYIFLAMNNLYYFHNTKILNEKDIKLLKNISSEKPPETIALGKTSIGYNYGAMVQWYLQRKLSNYEPGGEPPDYILAFNPNISPFEKNEIQKMANNGYRFVTWGNYLFLLRHK